jgi:threonine dehydrogenase-like Zn-dependent dehydrogenase
VKNRGGRIFKKGDRVVMTDTGRRSCSEHGNSRPSFAGVVTGVSATGGVRVLRDGHKTSYVVYPEDWWQLEDSNPAPAPTPHTQLSDIPYPDS